MGVLTPFYGCNAWRENMNINFRVEFFFVFPCLKIIFMSSCHRVIFSMYGPYGCASDWIVSFQCEN